MRERTMLCAVVAVLLSGCAAKKPEPPAPGGSRDGAVASLMKNAFAMGGTHVVVQTLHEPR